MSKKMVTATARGRRVTVPILSGEDFRAHREAAKQRRVQVREWFLQGYSQRAIAKAFGVHEAAISRDIKRMGLKRNLPPLPTMTQRKSA